jgi:hypothetical protein
MNQFDWTTRTVILLTLACVGASFARHRVDWLYLAINIAVAVVFLTLVAILIRKKQIRSRLALLWIVPCVMNGLQFLNQWTEHPWSPFAVLNGLCFLINVGIVWGHARLNKTEIYS